MSIDQTRVVSSNPNETNSQGDPFFEAARGQTTRFNEDDLPEYSTAPLCASCGVEMPGKRFIVMMEKINGYYNFVDAT
eukprot:1458364-Prorocentrum_lima.AAC.1